VDEVGIIFFKVMGIVFRFILMCGMNIPLGEKKWQENLGIINSIFCGMVCKNYVIMAVVQFLVSLSA
jgi:hypothetical protein